MLREIGLSGKGTGKKSLKCGDQYKYKQYSWLWSSEQVFLTPFANKYDIHIKNGQKEKQDTSYTSR